MAFNITSKTSMLDLSQQFGRDAANGLASACEDLRKGGVSVWPDEILIEAGDAGTKHPGLKQAIMKHYFNSAREALQEIHGVTERDQLDLLIEAYRSAFALHAIADMRRHREAIAEAVRDANALLGLKP